jgi:uncharacterized protein
MPVEARGGEGGRFVMDDTGQLDDLELLCRSLGKLVIAFSGGLDSRFLLHTARRVGVSARALHISGPHIPLRETEEARQWAEEHGIALTLLQVDPLRNPALRANAPDRCYHCKRAAFRALLAETTAGEVLCDGTNISDFSGYRPGLRALKELGVRSPLAEAGLSKDDIRRFARQTGMDRPEQKARPCLFTRYEYGLEPEASSLAALDEAERRVEEFFAADGHGEAIPPFRLRLTKNGPVLHVQVEALADRQQTALGALLLECGVQDARVEAVHQVSGYFDRQAGFKGNANGP